MGADDRLHLDEPYACLAICMKNIMYITNLWFQNAILQRHAEEVSGATAKLRAETAAAAERTAALLSHRRALVAALVQGLNSLAIPGTSWYIFLLLALKCSRASGRSLRRRSRLS